MNRIRLLAIATVLMFALGMVAQQPTSSAKGSSAGTQNGGHGHGMPSVEDHVKLLSEKLDLTADQQAKAKPIVQEMQDGMQKTMHDESLSQEERHAKLKALHETADKKFREILNDEQKKKLDQLEHEHDSGDAHRGTGSAQH
jgi:Spy/CpxP family protein refolding chaperone